MDTFDLLPEGTRIEFSGDDGFLVYPDGGRRPLREPVEPETNPNLYEMREVGLSENQIGRLLGYMKANKDIAPKYWRAWLNGLPKVGAPSSPAAR